MLSVLYTLPNLYPSDPSVQVTPNRGFAIDAALNQRIEAALKKAGVTAKSLDKEKDSLLVRMPELR